MIAAITSKRGGVGCTTIGLLVSLYLSKYLGKSVCIVDLKNTNDVARLLHINTEASIDNLITDLGIDNDIVSVEDNICDYDKISVIPGTTVPLITYLYKKSTNIKELLKRLDESYDIVIIDVKDDLLYEDLKAKGLNLLQINVLEQNMLVISEYQEVMQSGYLDGLIVVNKLDNSVIPEKNKFLKNFDKNNIYFLENNNLIKNVMNSSLNLAEISKTQFFMGIKAICERIVKEMPKYVSEEDKICDDTDSLFYEASIENKKSRMIGPKKKKSLFSALFGKGGRK